jgi:ribonuclease T1
VLARLKRFLPALLSLLALALAAFALLRSPPDTIPEQDADIPATTRPIDALSTTVVAPTLPLQDRSCVGPQTYESVLVVELPPEALDTIALIDSGGPFPYARDGIVFQNREGLLPEAPPGYYQEYTVPTPGEADRGARRIVTGACGEQYYTDDHYQSFRIIEEP